MSSITINISISVLHELNHTDAADTLVEHFVVVNTQ